MTKPPQDERSGGGRLSSPALVETVAGLSAGTMATLIVHPLDIVKTRMQSIFFILFFYFSSSQIYMTRCTDW